jgi:hypothetical protein
MLAMGSVVQLVPRRATVPDGVGDHSTLLADGLFKHFGITSHFVQSDPAAHPRLDRWPTLSLEARTGALLRNLLARLTHEQNPQALIIHLSLYGYQARGIPFWLAEGLEGWKRYFPNVPIICLFHELWSSHGSPLRSAFWLWPLQRRIALRILDIADASITTTGSFKQRLKESSPNLTPEPIVLNVFSNMGEPQEIPPTDHRPARIACFGGVGIARLMCSHALKLRNVLASAGIREIVDIGARTEQPPSSIFSIPVIPFGTIPAEQVSALLLHSRFGIMPYGNRQVLGKSGIFAAYASHGVIPVALESSHEDGDGLSQGTHYVGAVGAHRPLNEIQANIRQWYAGHALEKHVIEIGRVLHPGIKCR